MVLSLRQGWQDQRPCAWAPTLGWDWPKPRAEAATARSKLDDGIDPAAEAREAAQKAKEEASQAKAARMPTVEAFAPEFIERHSKRQKRSWR